jgi:hypothetical protein
VDIAGLVEGASEGEGLGNQFLANIREVDAIAHVLRCFDDDDIAHVLGSVDPVRDREVVETELALSDLDMVERRLERVAKKAKSGEKDAMAEESVLRKVFGVLSEGRPVRELEFAPEEERILRSFQLLTSKPVLYVANVAEGDLPEGDNPRVRALREKVAEEGAGEVVVVCSSIESELAELEPEEKALFLEELGLEETGLDRLIHAAYHLLGLLTFFTTGEKESRAWTARRGSTAPQCAGVIHSDFERGFIRAETIGYDEYVEVGSWKDARDQGRLRQEGKEYVVADADIMLFRFNV